VPAYFIYMTADPATIDVNIHPTKTEIKFEDETVCLADHAGLRPRGAGPVQRGSVARLRTRGRCGDSGHHGQNSSATLPQIEVDHTFNPFEGTEYQRPETKWKWDAERKLPRDWESLFTITARSGNKSESESGDDMSTGRSADSGQATGQRRFFQVKNRYIMCPVISGIMMIDQRRAHERVLYEKYLASLGDGPRNRHRYRSSRWRRN
jgi:DNA mismatch repair protein MutL